MQLAGIGVAVAADAVHGHMAVCIQQQKPLTCMSCSSMGLVTNTLPSLSCWHCCRNRSRAACPGAPQHISHRTCQQHRTLCGDGSRLIVLCVVMAAASVSDTKLVDRGEALVHQCRLVLAVPSPPFLARGTYTHAASVNTRPALQSSTPIWQCLLAWESSHVEACAMQQAVPHHCWGRHNEQAGPTLREASSSLLPASAASSCATSSFRLAFSHSTNASLAFMWVSICVVGPAAKHARHTARCVAQGQDLCGVQPPHHSTAG